MKIFNTNLVSLALIFSVVTLTIFPWYFPLTDGWWEVYAWLSLKGQVLYKDFYLAFPPLQVLFTKVQIEIFGYNFFLIRMFGAVFDVLAVLVVYLWLKNFNTNRAAFFGTLISALLVIETNSAYVAGDYHSLVLFFEGVALLCLSIFISVKTQYLQSKLFNSLNQFIPLLIAGLACGCLLLTKQNIGVFFTLAILLVIIIQIKSDSKLLHIFCCGFLFFIGCLLPLLLTTIFLGPDWISSYLSNHSKGNIFLVLTRFIGSADCRKLLISFILLAVLFYLFPKYKKNYFSFLEKISLPILFFEINESFLFRACLYLMISFWLKTPLTYIIFAIALFRLLYIAFVDTSINDSRSRSNWYRLGWIPLLALAYCGTHTAGYNFSSMQLIIAAVLADFTDRFLPASNDDRPINLAITKLSVLLSLVVIAIKIFGNIYNWWGVTQKNILNADQPIPFVQLDGFRVDKQTSEFYKELLKYKKILKNDDQIFAYPSIPIVYLLLNKIPQTKFPVLWFDVSDSKNASEVIRQLEVSNPALIFWLKPPQFVYNEHFKLRKTTSLLAAIDDWVILQLISKQFKVDTILFHESDFDVKEFKKPVVKNFLVLDVNLTCEALYEIDGVISSNVSDLNCLHNPNLYGKKVNIEFESEYSYRKNAIKIGIPNVYEGEAIFIVLSRNK